MDYVVIVGKLKGQSVKMHTDWRYRIVDKQELAQFKLITNGERKQKNEVYHFNRHQVMKSGAIIDPEEEYTHFRKQLN